MKDDERLEKATGVVNGFNVVFFVSSAYKAGTLKVFVNGQLRQQLDDDGWIEHDPANGEFRMLIPPDNDKIFARYIEA